MKPHPMFCFLIVFFMGCYTLSEFSYNVVLRESRFKALLTHPYFYVRYGGKPSLSDVFESEGVI